MKFAVVALALIGAVLAAPMQEEVVQEFERGNHLLTAALYKELVNENTGNLIVSPFSLETVLSLIYEGARGQTAAEIVNGLSLPDSNEKIRAAYKLILPKLKGTTDDMQIATANKIYLKQGAELQDSFNSVATSVYQSGVENLDFSQNQAAANEINSWVEKQTNSKIKNLVDPGSIDGDTVVVLVNTLYLSGKWASPFLTSEMPDGFYRSKDDTVSINTMELLEEFNYWENKELNAQFLELPLKGGNVSMVIALPYELDGLTGLEQNIEKVFEPQENKKQAVYVVLPKFSISSQIEFIPVLRKMGISTPFTSDADFSGLSSTDKDLYINQIVQKTYIDVSETGIEAAAATDVAGPSGIQVTSFDATHPFLYYIKQNGVVLFSGRFVNPEE